MQRERLVRLAIEKKEKEEAAKREELRQKALAEEAEMNKRQLLEKLS